MSSTIFGIYPPPPPSPPQPYDGDHNDVGRFGYGIGVSIGVLLIIITVTLASYFCSRTLSQHHPPRRPGPPEDGSDNRRDQCTVDLTGLDEATIKSYPKIIYSGEAKKASSCCSICLADYKGNDELRRLPECKHLFHTKCVDPWLRMNATCPVCRTSPLPTPVSTPLAEITPLAAGRSGS